MYAYSSMQLPMDIDFEGFFSILHFKDETIIFITFIGRYLKITQNNIAIGTTTTFTFFFLS